MTVFHPAPREPEQAADAGPLAGAQLGGDPARPEAGRVIVLPPTDGSQQVLALSTGRDSVVVVRIPDQRWDRAPALGNVHVHEDHDETIVLPTGSGWLIHGRDLAVLQAVRFEGPVMLTLPATVWHHVVMDRDVVATGSCFFTDPAGSVPPAIETSSTTTALVPLAAIPLSDRVSDWVGGWSGQLRVVEEHGHIVGHDDDGPLHAAVRSAVVEFRALAPDLEPVDIDVHRRDDADEVVVVEHGQGYLVTGVDADALTLTPFQAPAVVVMPAGAFHRIVMSETDGSAIAARTDPRTTVVAYEQILERTPAAAVDGALEGTNA